MLRKKEEGRRKKEEGRRKKEEGRRKKEEGRRKKEEGRRKREEGRGKREEGGGKKEKGRELIFIPFQANDDRKGSVRVVRCGEERTTSEQINLYICINIKV